MNHQEAEISSIYTGILRPMQVRKKYKRAVQYFLDGPEERTLDLEAEEAWNRAYQKEGRPTGMLEVERTERLLLNWQEELRGAMRGVCARASKAELLFALRLGHFA